MATALERKRIRILAENFYENNELNFNKNEIVALLKKFRQYAKHKMDKTVFQDIILHQFNITDAIMMDRIYRVFDDDSDSFVSMEEWVRGMSVFLRGSTEEQIRFCFLAYDINGDGVISREEIFQFLRATLVGMDAADHHMQDADESIRDLVEIILRKLDLDGDNRISYGDFHDAVTDETLLLEALGQCLPKEEYIKSFEASLEVDPNRFY